jgi:hypothetical protein
VDGRGLREEVLTRGAWLLDVSSHPVAAIRIIVLITYHNKETLLASDT